MDLKYHIKNLEKKKIISRKPHPIVPFILTGIILILYVYSMPLSKNISLMLLILAIFTLGFSVIHYLIFRVLK